MDEAVGAPEDWSGVGNEAASWIKETVEWGRASDC
jgi:hypothetical protein